jgi:tRNA A-37 threonylcarbamoyl transferase component Bud32
MKIQHANGQAYYKKQQVGHTYRSLRHPFGYPTIAREVKALLAASSLGVPTPSLLYSDVRKLNGEWQSVMLTAALDGFVSLEDFYNQGVVKLLGQTLHLEILMRYGGVLAQLNMGGWQHGCLYLKHIFVDIQTPVIKVALLDFEKARRRLTVRQAARHDLRQVKRRSGWAIEEWQAFCRGYSCVSGLSVEQLL